ncbi:ATP-binding cassette domain-containing protein [Streptomyces bottropensis]|uniref:ATP-binding cassette domain-containing protein n=1 Tax=Streptomyces bottropensis TaxID=42235 RepID=UPI0036B9118C
MDSGIRMENLTKSYGSVHALEGVSLDVPTGSVLGLLGPNGAGKTTAVKILTTLARPDDGMAWVGGFDVAREPWQVRRRIGVSGQETAVDPLLTGTQNLEWFGRIGRLSRRQARDRARQLLEIFDLTEVAGRLARTYSGGTRRRLDLAVSLVSRPEILFLDEPTTGLDPRSRTATWDIVRELVDGGTTLLLTTQYLEEADRLADRVAVIDRGRLLAEGTVEELKTRTSDDRIEIVASSLELVPKARTVVSRFSTSPPVVVWSERRIWAMAPHERGLFTRLMRDMDAAGIELDDVELRRPTLDDVFLQLTGRPAEAPRHGEDVVR